MNWWIPSKAPKRFWSFIVHLYLQTPNHLQKEYLVKTILDFLRFHLREKWLLHVFGFMLVFWDVNQLYEPLTIHASSSKNHPSSSSLSSLQIHIRLHLSCMKHLQKVWDLLHEHGDRIACLQVLFFPDFYVVTSREALSMVGLLDFFPSRKVANWNTLFLGKHQAYLPLRFMIPILWATSNLIQSNLNDSPTWKIKIPSLIELLIESTNTWWSPPQKCGISQVIKASTPTL